MTTEIVFSDVITNDVANPRVPNTSLTDGGVARISSGKVTLTTGKTTGSVYPVVRIPTNARVSGVKLSNAAGSPSSACSIGVYKTISSGATADGVTVAIASSDSFFASAVAMTNANNDTQSINTAGNVTPAKRQQPLWQMLGVATDPGGKYDICLTNTATNAAGFDAYLEVSWTL